MEKLHFVDCSLLLSEDENLLILHNKRRPVFNLNFSFGCVAFIFSMFFKAMHNEQIAALPLAFSTVILMSGVWKLSGAGKIYFDKAEGKIFRFYKHLGYVQKLYITPLRSVDLIEINLKKNPSLGIRLDNNQLLNISNEKSATSSEIKILGEKISKFISVKLKMAD